jgi:cell division protein FtsQ
VKKKILFLIFTVFILIFSGAYIYAFYSPRYNVAEIRVKGNSKITKDEITKKAESCLGKNIFSLNLRNIEEKLKEDVRLRNVRIKKVLPASILIEVEEKTPILWISLPAGFVNHEDYGLCGLSSDQEIIPLDKNDLSSDLPIVSGVEVEEIGGKSVRSLRSYQRWHNFKVEKALEFYAMLLKNDPSSVELISEINLADAPNLILYLLPYGNKVMMGPDDFERKWKRVRTILSAEKKIEELVCLDLRFDEQVVLTRSSKESSSSDVDSANHPPDNKDKNPKKSRG